MSEEPLYWGTWKGRVVKAIAIDGARTWSEIRDQTGLSPTSLQRVLAELFQLEAIQKWGEGKDAEYRVGTELYKSYRRFFESQQDDKKAPVARITENEQRELVSWIGQWMTGASLAISLQHHHFYLQGGKLTNFSEELILHARKQVLVVNRFVDQCDLSDSLWKTASKEKEILVITQPADKDKDEKSKARKEKQHQVLRGRGVRVIYSERAHAKLILVDKSVAVVSSMNMTSLSAGGSSWEAGLVTKEDTVAESIIDSVYQLLERPDSEETT